MKHYLFLGLAIMLPYVFNAQLFGKLLDKKIKKENEDFYNKTMEQEGTDFEVIEVPEKWQNEEAVILCQKVLVASRLKLREGYVNHALVRRQLKIQDKSILGDYSEFYFQDNEFVVVKVIKPDGTIIEIDVSQAIEVDTEVPKIHSGFFYSEKYYKVAISNLEVGDILDYSKVFRESTGDCRFGLSTKISYDYPVVYQKFVFESGPLVELVYNSFNNAPQFEYLKGNEFTPYFDGGQRLVLEDQNRAAPNREPWSHTYRHEPTLKISMYQPLNSMSRYVRSEAKEKLSWEKYLKKESGFMANDRVTFETRAVNYFIKQTKNELKSMNTEKKVNRIHRIVRHVLASSNPLSYNPSHSEKYMALMTKTLKNYDIYTEHVITTPRTTGTLEEVIFADEYVYGVYIPTLDKYYWYQGGYSIAGESRSDIAGAKAYKAGKGKINKPLGEFEEVVIPLSTSINNVLHTKMDISFRENDLLLLSNETIYSGKHRFIYSEFLISEYDYPKEEQMALSDDKTKKWLAKQKSEFTKEQLQEIKEARENSIQELIKSDYEINELLDHKVVEYGNTNKSPNLIWEYEATSDAYVSKAGNNLILELGKLISSQVELTEDEIENRTKDVEYDFAREFIHEVNITLPAGYIAKGLEQFNMNVDSEHAAFISSVVQEGNVLKLKARKAYKSQTVPVENWSELVEMLEAAYNFTQKKVILSKS
ncbi:MAG: DUF3857 domain-containing protein [Bacteroidota bacterium]